MVYQHKGQSFRNRAEPVREVKKRYYVLNFICTNCDTFNRLKELDIDFMGRFHCPDCGKTSYTIKKVAISKQNILSKEEASIVMIENIHIKGESLDG